MPRLSCDPWEFDEVFIDFNGPQLAVIRSAGRKYLAVASNESSEDGFQRWLKVPLSRIEYQALLEGATTIGDAFRKRRLDVVDLSFGDGQPIRQWSIALEDLSADDLPAPKALLPRGIREKHVPTPTRPVIMLDGTESPVQGIRFRALGELTTNFQRLWNALAQAAVGTVTERGQLPKELLDRSALSVEAFAPGSLQIHIDMTDIELFAAVAASFARLLEAGDDEHALYEIFQNLQVRVRSTYRDLLATLSHHEVQFYTSFGTLRSFLGPAKAERVRSRLSATAEADARPHETVGYFIAVNLRQGTFEFYDQIQGESYTGTIISNAFEDGVIEIGATATYSGMFSVLALRDPLTGTMMSYQLVRAKRM